MGRQAERINRSIADGAQRLRAKEEVLRHCAQSQIAIAGVQRICSKQEIYSGEDGVHNQIPKSEEPEKPRPRHPDQLNVCVPGGATESSPADIEGAVLIDGADKRTGVLLRQAGIKGWRHVFEGISGASGVLLSPRPADGEATSPRSATG